MKIIQSTREYETWLGKHLRLVPEDLDLKHQRMRAAIFPFFRATFYRWTERFPAVCKPLAKAPAVLAVGDLHADNFGTWRDSEGRLAWGVNDFDEAYPLPYTNDLVRLATSIHIAAREGHLAVSEDDACDALLDGYRAHLGKGASAYVLAEEHVVLRHMMHAALGPAEAFWKKLNAQPEVTTKVRRSVRDTLERALPSRKVPYRVLHRVAGLGSLGRERFLALAHWNGALIAREAKALAPSAAGRWENGKIARTIHYDEIVRQAVRCPDPMLRARSGWVVRRLSPDCVRVELSELREEREAVKLVRAMGAETANVHARAPNASDLAQHLARQPAHWLHRAAAAMRDDAVEDWHAFRARRG